MLYYKYDILCKVVLNIYLDSHLIIKFLFPKIIRYVMQSFIFCVHNIN